LPLSTASLSVPDPWQLTRRLAEVAPYHVDVVGDGGIRRQIGDGHWTARPVGSELVLVVSAADGPALRDLEHDLTDRLATHAPEAPDPAWQDPVDGADIEILGPMVNDYVSGHSPRPDEVLRDLIAETISATGGSAGMQVSPDEGALLTLLTSVVGARLAVEVGTFTGYSSICIARGLADGGRLITCDTSEEWTGIARKYWERAGLSHVIEARLGPALVTLASLPHDLNIDVAFIDADKDSYPAYFEQLVPRMRVGGLILIDNVFLGGRVFDPAYQEAHHVAMRKLNDLIAVDERVDAVMLPVRDGLTVARRR